MSTNAHVVGSDVRNGVQRQTLTFNQVLQLVQAQSRFRDVSAESHDAQRGGDRLVEASERALCVGKV